jgi:two-component system nitrogen regulation response regulator GlnG
MQIPTDTDLTLDSIPAFAPCSYAAQELVLTILFHPDTTRIGQRVEVPKLVGNAPWVLGRRGPAFQAPGDDRSIALEDGHISRRALQLIYNGKALTIRRFDSSSRCRVGSSELYDRVELNAEQLQAGVPMLLGHSIVLMLRLALIESSALQKHDDDERLRGKSAAMGRVRDQISSAAQSDLDVLVRGETGTGKELVAAAIHGCSRRARAPIVSVNMAAIPSALAAAALFGSARGAFTGADKATPGYFDQAQGGSLFLDEIGDTSVDVQPQLLRALQQREIQSVGGPIRRVDVRVIAATDAVLEGEGCDFKAALRYRLGAIEILLPPLRKHPEDIGELLLFYLHKSAEESGRTQLLPDEQSPAPLVAAWAVLFLSFASYSWPGNVRELANFAQQIILASEKSPVLTEPLRAAFAADSRPVSPAPSHSTRRRMQDIDDAAFDQAMSANGCQVKRVAAHLGVSRTSVYRRIEISADHRLVSDIPEHELRSVVDAHGGDANAAAVFLRVSVSSLRRRLRKLSVEA